MELGMHRYQAPNFLVANDARRRRLMRRGHKVLVGMSYQPKLNWIKANVKGEWTLPLRGGLSRGLLIYFGEENEAELFRQKFK